MNETTLRAAIYARISLKDAKVPKVDNQVTMCRKLAADNDYAVEARHVFKDDGISASNLDHRPGWEDLLKAAERGEFDVILAQSEDRFARRLEDKVLLQVVCDAQGIKWHTVNDGRTDPGTADGEFFSTLRAGLARMESRRKGERMRQANEARREKGEPQIGGDRPFGYEENKLELNEFEAALVRQAYEDVAYHGKTPSGIKHAWNKGIRTEGRDMLTWVRTSRGNAWSTESVVQVLRRPKNAGINEREGVRYEKCLWKAIVSEELYREALEQLDNPDRKLERRHEPKHLCTGLVTCASCDTPLASNPNARGLKYRCRVHQGEEPRRTPTGGHVEITAKILDEVVAREVANAVLFAPRSAVSDPDADRLRTLRAKLVSLSEAKAKLVEAVEVGALDLSDVAARKKAIEAETRAAEDEVASIAASNAKASLLADVSLFLTERTSLEDMAETRRTVVKRFNEELSLDQRRALVRGMLSVEVRPGRNDRVKVTHLVATSLNEPTEEYVA